MSVQHFDLPLRLIGGSMASVEQDTHKDVRNCVEAILRTQRGTRLYVPHFGIDDPAFTLLPVDTNKMYGQIRLNEARAIMTFSHLASEVQRMVDEITAGVDSNGI